MPISRKNTNIFREREKMKTWYLAHDFEDRHRVRKIQKYIESIYKINLLNPFYDTQRDDIIKIDIGIPVIRSEKDCKNVRDEDLAHVRYSDGVLCIINSSGGIGSYMEVFYASKILDKPVYFVCPIKKIREHLWIRSNTFKIFKNIKELESYFIENDMVQK